MSEALGPRTETPGAPQVGIDHPPPQTEGSEEGIRGEAELNQAGGGNLVPLLEHCLAILSPYECSAATEGMIVGCNCGHCVFVLEAEKRIQLAEGREWPKYMCGTEGHRDEMRYVLGLGWACLRCGADSHIQFAVENLTAVTMERDELITARDELITARDELLELRDDRESLVADRAAALRSLVAASARVDELEPELATAQGELLAMREQLNELRDRCDVIARHNVRVAQDSEELHRENQELAVARRRAADQATRSAIELRDLYEAAGITEVREEDPDEAKDELVSRVSNLQQLEEDLAEVTHESRAAGRMLGMMIGIASTLARREDRALTARWKR